MESYSSKRAEPLSTPPDSKELFDSFPVQKVEMDNIRQWLVSGWEDLKQNPLASLAYGLIFAMIGIVLSIVAAANPVFVAASTTGFLLAGPFFALGLYDLSRRIEHNEPPTFTHSLSVVTQNAWGLGIYALALGLLSLIWIRGTALVVGILFSAPTITADGYIGLFTGLMAMEQGWAFILGFFGAGLAFAIVAFVTGVVTVPMLLHRKVDIVTAGATSIRAVLKNPVVMMAWAATITVVIGLGMATFYLGLIVAMPLIAHASWHAYRDLVDQQASKPE